MSLRSWWGSWRRPAEPVGRHSVGAPVVPPIVVPGAAASLVAQSATAEILASSVAPAGASGAHVTLGFADGGSVVLPDDDPRVRTFRAAAEAIVEAR